MTLENTLRERLSEWQPPAGRQELPVTVGRWTATVAADRNDVVGCLVWELTLRRDGSDETELPVWGSNVAERVAGLMEPLKVVEIDTVRKVAQLRSDMPLDRGGKSFYYELLLNGFGVAVLRRYQTTAGSGQRQQIAFALTHEVLAKLAGDVTDAALQTDGAKE